MSFTQHLQLLLDPASTLPLHLDLGKHSCSWVNGKFKIAQSQQPGFRRQTRDELMQLMRRLHAAPHAVLLNLNDNYFGEGVMQEMAAPIAALSKLQVLVLSCTCPPPPPYCILRAHVNITTAAATATPSLAPCVVDVCDVDMREGAFVFVVLFGRCEVCHDDEEHTIACMHDDCGH